MISRYTLLKSKISKTEGLLTTYLPGHDVKQAFDKEDYVKSLLLAANHTEAQLRFFYNRIQEKKKGKITLRDLIKYNNVPLKDLINQFKNEKRITPKERKILHELREIRNDIAHNYQLNFNHNIDIRVCKRVIDTILPVIDSLHKRMIEELRNP